MTAHPYVLELDDNGTLLISFPDFPNAHTFAESIEDIEMRAQDCIDTALQTLGAWKPVSSPPYNDRQVLVKGEGGYRNFNWHFESAHWDGKSWLSDSSDHLSESWPEPLYWRELSDDFY